jgi:iron complex transport system substrate-binding protein
VTHRSLRVCSLLPSATEIVAGLGCADLLVGRSAECNYPPDVARLPVVTAARIETGEMTSMQIDDTVRAAVLEGRSLYAIDEALIRSLQPDLIITQDLCHVCAVSSDDVRGLASLDVETIALDPRTIEGIWDSVLLLADRLGVSERGRWVVGEAQARIDSISSAVGESRPRVFVAEWIDPPFAAGHWVPEMVALAGGTEVLGRAGEPSYPTTWEAVRAAEPDIIVLAPCGFDAQRAASEATQLPAGLNCRTVAVDGDAYYSRPAPRVTAGVAQLAHLLHPDAVPDPGLPEIEIGSDRLVRRGLTRMLQG